MLLGEFATKTTLMSHLHQAEDALARLDERLATSPIRAGWISRTHILDACAALWLEGELVTAEDLVLHDASSDARTPTPELTRAFRVLEARRRILAAAPGWALSDAGIDQILGRVVPVDVPQHLQPAEPDPLDAELAAIDALIARGRAKLAGLGPIGSSGLDDPEASGLDDSDRKTRLDRWRAVHADAERTSPVAGAAMLACAWTDIKPIEGAAWLGPLIAADYLRARKKTRVHLAILNVGLRAVARERRRDRDPARRHEAVAHAMALAAELGLADHDRWRSAAQALARKIAGHRKTSHLPRLVDLVIASPLVTARTVAADLAVTPRAAQNLIDALDLRELTGRSRYRAWAVL